MSPAKLRDDILVSVCFPDVGDPDTARACIASVAEALKAHYRYFEILIVNENGHEAEFDETLIAVPNLRYLSVVRGLDNSQRRVVAASEAIGDIVVMTSVHEVATMDITSMIDESASQSAVVLGQRRAAVVFEPLIVALGRLSGFRASTSDMQTAAFPRTILNRLLSDPNPVLALRFLPRDNTVPVLRRAPHKPTGTLKRERSNTSRLFSRFDLLMRMVTEAGPAFLSAVALLSALMFVSAILFAIYVVVVYLVKSNVAEGWTTLSLAISGMLGFLGAALFAICVTLRKVAEIMRGRTIDYLVAERSSVDLFNSVAKALNVDTDGSEGTGPVRHSQDEMSVPQTQNWRA